MSMGLELVSLIRTRSADPNWARGQHRPHKQAVHMTASEPTPSKPTFSLAIRGPSTVATVTCGRPKRLSGRAGQLWQRLKPRPSPNHRDGSKAGAAAMQLGKGRDSDDSRAPAKLAAPPPLA